jgi:LuxR family maltose regulon positive regulatory protein
LVPRERLLQRLGANADLPVAALIAPAGYGKTTLLNEWAARDERPFAWVDVGDADNDPARLMGAISTALDGLMVDRRFVLVLDDVQRLRRTEALAVLTRIADHLGEGAQLAFAARSEPGLPLGRMRAHHVMAELRMHDLAMTREEAGRMLAAAGLELTSAQVATLVQRTEGWPAALHLAALSLREQSDVGRAVARFAGDDRLVNDYMRDELLSKLSPERLGFLLQTAVLDELSGPLCDAVLHRSGSAGLLREMSRGNLLLIPVDRNDTGYRYHPLLRDCLRNELRRDEPGRARELHRRTSAWYAEHGDPDRAIEHAVAAEDAERAGELLWARLPHSQLTTVQRCLDRFPAGEIAAHPSLALTAAACALHSNRAEAAERWTLVAAQALDRRPAAGSADLEAGVAIMRAALARDGMSGMRRDAARAHELLLDKSPWRSASCLLDGVARHLSGEREEARHRLEEGVRWAAFAGVTTIQALCLAELAVLDGGGPQGPRDGSHGIEGAAQVERAGLAEVPQMALVFAAAADVHTRRGQIDAGARELQRAQLLMAALGDGVASWYQVETRVLLARGCLRLCDVARARTLLAEAERFLPRTPDSEVLVALLDDVRAQAGASVASSVRGSSSLTTAELRVLQFLPTHLSLREIAERLYVSTNTVKTQAHATYRKLDACSRAEAVDRARALGLLEDKAAGGPSR